MHPSPAVAALRAAYPAELPDDGVAVGWARSRRAALTGPVTGTGDGPLAVSSGCAAAGAARHRSGLAEPAATTLLRLDDGSLTDCAQCGQRLGFDRLDALPGVVSCAAAGAPPPTGPTPVRTGRGRCP